MTSHTHTKTKTLGNTWPHKADEGIKGTNAKQMKKDRGTLHPPFRTGIDQEHIKKRAEYALLTPISKSVPEELSRSQL